MAGRKTFEEHYQSLTDGELLKLRSEGGFTREAEQALDGELARRNLTLDQAKREFAPEWLGKAGVGTVGVLVLQSGERITAEVAGLDEERDRLAVRVISPESRGGHRSHRAIPLRRIVSFEPQPHLMEQWPFTDPCRDWSFSSPRSVVLSIIFLCATLGSVPLFLSLRGRPWGLQEASMVSYTLSVVFLTFAHTGSRGGPDVPPFKFTCPAVEPQIPRLLWRHAGFLVALVALETAMLQAGPHLPEWWTLRDSKGGTPFDLVLMFLCIGLGYAQVFSNRALLKRAHREFTE
jgi:hypothetical protein